jgi:hypothetical protein
MFESIISLFGICFCIKNEKDFICFGGYGHLLDWNGRIMLSKETNNEQKKENKETQVIW